uniref:Uncharacterized protein n=1 Tax=Pyricularia oryzae (strain 70-15 / ATCC MYA-4617 / FGSC 8958) TaxID=242507 RepID=Q2KEY3_PYRO7|nr:hypothetical protein MGCH7_ch7g903 [Pyricularia oryzae 70-15]
MDDGIDTDIFDELRRSTYIDGLRCTPKPALVIEIYKSVVGPPYVLATKRTPGELDEWINKYWGCSGRRTQSHNTHLKTYRTRRSVIGLTARYFYVEASDVALSMSYCPQTDITTALMIGPTVRQTEFLRAELSRLARVAHHPALVPTLMADCLRDVLGRRVDVCMMATGLIETEWMHMRPMPSGRDVVNVSARAVDNARDLGIIETDLEMLEAQVAGTVDFVQLTSDASPRSEKGKEKSRADMLEIGLILEERLNFVSSTITHPRLRARMYKERTLSILSAALFSTSFMAAANPPQWTFWATVVPLTAAILAGIVTWRLWTPPSWLRRWPDMAYWMRRLKRKLRRRFRLNDDASSTTSGSTSLVEDD